jgi:ribosome-binding factor A
MVDERFPSKRQLKVAELIKKGLVQFFAEGKILAKELIDVSITVSEVRVSPDLKIARAYVVPFATNMEPNKFLELLNSMDREIRSSVTKIINLKYSPKIIFRFDESFDQADKIERIFYEISSKYSEQDKEQEDN